MIDLRNLSLLIILITFLLLIFNSLTLATDYCTKCGYEAKPKENFKIAFVKKGNIWICNDDGTEAKKITSNGKCTSPVWSPDGKNIIYERIKKDGFNDNELWIKNLNEGKEYKFTYGFRPFIWLSNNDIFFLRIKSNGSPDYGYIFKKNTISHEESKIADNDRWGFSGVSIVSAKSKLIGCYGLSGRGTSSQLIDFSGKKITLPDIPSNISYTCTNLEDYNTFNSTLLVSFSDMKVYPTAYRGLYSLNLNTNEILSYEHLLHGKWAKDSKCLIGINSSHNLVKVNAEKTITLTSSSDIYKISGIVGNKIFYIRKTGIMDYGTNNDNYYLWVIGLDGSSPKRITEGDFYITENIDINNF